MDHVVSLLNERNMCLDKFYWLNESELLNFGEGDFSNLESFYDTREGILEMVRRLDTLIDDSSKKAAGTKIMAADKKKVIMALDSKNELVTRILAQDLQILSFIEAAKSKIIKELSEVRTSKKALGAYKSGIELQSLDEKA